MNAVAPSPVIPHPDADPLEVRLRRAVNWAIHNSAHARALVFNPLWLVFTGDALEQDRDDLTIRLRAHFRQGALELCWLDGPFAMGVVTIFLPGWMAAGPVTRAGVTG